MMGQHSLQAELANQWQARECDKCTCKTECDKYTHDTTADHLYCAHYFKRTLVFHLLNCRLAMLNSSSDFLSGSLPQLRRY